MPALSTLDGIDIVKFQTLLKDVVLEYLKMLRKHKKHLPTDLKYTLIDSGYEKKWLIEWEYISLAFHKQIAELQKVEPLLQFVLSDSNLRQLLIDPMPERERSTPIIPRTETRSEGEIQRGSLHSRLVDPFLEHYICKANSLTFKRSIFDATYSILKKALLSSKDEGVILCPIANLVINTNKIQVADNVVIRKLHEKEIEKWIGESGWDDLPHTFSELSDLKCGVEFSFEKERDYTGVFGSYVFTSSDFNPERKVVQSVLTPLQLTFGRKLVPTFLQIEITNGFFERSLYYGWREIYDFDCKLVGSDLRFYRKILRSINKRDQIPNLDLAIKKFDEAKERLSLKDAILDYWTALETLFIRDSKPEKKYRAILRISSFLGDTKKERADMYDLLDKSYKYRSNIIHGTPVNMDRFEEGRLVGQTGTLVKRAIVKFLEADENIDIEALGIEKRLAVRGMGNL